MPFLPRRSAKRRNVSEDEAEETIPQSSKRRIKFANDDHENENVDPNDGHDNDAVPTQSQNNRSCDIPNDGHDNDADPTQSQNNHSCDMSQMIESEEWAEDVGDAFEEPNEEQLMAEIESIEAHRIDERDRIMKNVGALGSIISVTLTNFMCHSNFHIDLSPRINFIVGRNGSGKSAILNGIVLGLGGRATTTNRGKGVASFIKNGESQARIAIKLLNSLDGCEGSVGFRYDDYGRSIIIERIISQNGSSHYKIKSNIGKVISEKKSVIDDIVRHFHIQVDNPICILNQEVSRHFLNSNKPVDKYKFFMKATLLEDLKKKYAEAEETRVIAKNSLNAKKKIIPDVEHELLIIKRKVNLFKKMDNNLKDHQRYKHEYLWACINEKQKEVDSLHETVEGHQKKIDDETSKINSAEAEAQKIKEEKTDLEMRIQGFVHEVEEITQQSIRSSEEAIKIKEEFRKKSAEIRHLDMDFNDAVNNETDIRKGLKTHEDRFRDLTENRNKRQQQIEDLTKSVNDLKAEESSSFAEIEQYRTYLREVKLSLENAREEQRQINYQLSAKNRDKETLEHGQKNRLRRYGQKIPELVQRMNDAIKKGVFKVPPLGPIGEYLELSDESAAIAVEKCLKGLLYSFCCDNWDDTNKLRKIMSEVFRNNEKTPSIITRKFSQHQHDVQQYSVQCEQYKSILQLLQIKSPSIANVLIDRARIESILYIPNYDNAMQLLLHSHNVPKNCFQAYTSEGDVMHPQTRYSEFKSYAADKRFQTACILVSDASQRLNSLKEEIKNLERQKHDCDQNVTVVDKEYRAKDSQLRKEESALKRIKDDIYKKNVDISRLKNITEPDPVEISTLREELENLTVKKSDIEQRLNMARKELQTIKEKLQNADNEKSRIREKYDELLANKQPMDNELKKKEEAFGNCKRGIERRESRINDLKKEKENAEVTYEQAFSSLEDQKKTALEQTHEPISTRKSSRALKKQIEDLQKFFEEQERNIGNREQIIEEYKEKSDRLEKNKSEVKALDRHLTDLKESLKLRRCGYIEWRNYCTLMTKYFFTEVLKLKGFTGSLEVYHKEKILPNGEVKKEKTLEVKVNPKAKTELSQSQESNDKLYNDTRSLSGGERSYSTVAFILALWETSHSPFKILDEVDVFMDAITRQISLQAMVEFAAQKSGKQYLFLSPLRLQQLPMPELVKVFEMPEPDRGKK